MTDEVEGEVPEKRHARLGPSSSDIWLSCPGAPGEWDKHPDRSTTVTAGLAAKEGTLAHTLCEAAIQLQDIPWKEGMKFEVAGAEIVVTTEMLNAVSLYCTTIMSIADIASWVAVEKQLSYKWLWKDLPVDDLFGTTDFAAFADRVLYVIDFKFGRGKAVNVVGNTQLLLYALGAYGQLQKDRPDLAGQIDFVSLAVVQPRAGGSPVRQWTIPVGELFYWAYSTLKPSVEEIIFAVEPLPLRPGNHCFFCAASLECPAYGKLRRQRSVDSFPDWVPENEQVM